MSKFRATMSCVVRKVIEFEATDHSEARSLVRLYGLNLPAVLERTGSEVEVIEETHQPLEFLQVETIA